MALFSLEEVKRQLSMDADETLDDTLLEEIMEDCESILADDIQKTIFKTQALLDIETTPPENAVVFDKNLSRALKLLIGHYYNYREASNERTVKLIPIGYNHLIRHHKPAVPVG